MVFTLEFTVGQTILNVAKAVGMKNPVGFRVSLHFYVCLLISPAQIPWQDGKYGV